MLERVVEDDRLALAPLARLARYEHAATLRLRHLERQVDAQAQVARRRVRRDAGAGAQRGEEGKGEGHLADTKAGNRAQRLGRPRAARPRLLLHAPFVDERGPVPLTARVQASVVVGLPRRIVGGPAGRERVVLGADLGYRRLEARLHTRHRMRACHEPTREAQPCGSVDALGLEHGRAHQPREIVARVPRPCTQPRVVE